MATVLLSAVGGAIGGSIGGGLAGLSSVVIGRAVGATVGRLVDQRVVDQRLMGQGSDVVEGAQMDRFRLTNAAEGDAIAQVYGRMRLGGQVIWASDFLETLHESSTPGQSSRITRTYTYSVNLAIALCEGEITRVGRIWADGDEISPQDLNMRIYHGTKEQQPDSLIEAIEGQGQVPAYRGTAYVVIENLQLEPFGNRVPQFSFEVIRPEQSDAPDAEEEMTRAIKAVAMIPGTGEYALASTAVHYSDGLANRWSANVHTPTGKTDFTTSLDALNEELPKSEAASLVVSWFGDDLRCGHCQIRPKVENNLTDGENMPWEVSGQTRLDAPLVVMKEGRPLYGGTPADQSVIEAILALKAANKAVMFYPFILMDQGENNQLPDPYSDSLGQGHLPWRGRITTNKAPNVAGSTDMSAAAEAEVDAFFGTVRAADFTIEPSGVRYTGPDEWSLSRFVLHYAALCVAAGGVEAFCIGSEMRGLTQIRGPHHSFPAVARLVDLAAQVRALVGAQTKISYAADWSEYFGYQPQDGSGSRYFHLDPLWADENIDFIGIDNYMPLSDWRDGDAHLDAQEYETIYDLAYLQSNIEGGEGYDWYYHSTDAQAAQIRTPITDGAESEPWVFRYKDIRSFWQLVHYDRIDGVRAQSPTAWVPMSKPIWFTEFGCAAVDKGSNEPNKFLDVKSSESSLPKYSNGLRDDLMQKQYLRAMTSYWNDPQNNPLSEEYDGRMLDMSRAFVWAWDARPYPQFPNLSQYWSDGSNYTHGHWLNGRVGARSLASVVSEICTRAGLEHFDVSALYGYVRGYIQTQVTDARSALQPLMLRYGFDAIERGGVLYFKMRDGKNAVPLDPEQFALGAELAGALEQTREGEAQMVGRVRLGFVQADGDFETTFAESVRPYEATHAVSSSQVPIALTRAEGRQVTERWLSEAETARDVIRMELPLSQIGVGAGDVVALPQDANEGQAFYRVDRVEGGASQLLEAVRINPQVYEPSDIAEELSRIDAYVAPVPVLPIFMDLPLISGLETPHAPHIAVGANTWPGNVAVYASSDEENYELNTLVQARSTIGLTQNELVFSPAGIFDRGADLQVRLAFGALSSVTQSALLSGQNLAAIGDGSAQNWELFQFQEAELLENGNFALRMRLRGQMGTDALMPSVWPEGSYFVLLNGVQDQIDLPINMRQIMQDYRIGPASMPYDDASYVSQSHQFSGVGLRPYSPVHLRVQDLGDHHFSWTRRTRLEGDDWSLNDVPLNEEREEYRVQVHFEGEMVRETLLSSPEWIYAESLRLSDAVDGPYEVEIAQVSARYGAGLSAKIRVAA